MKYGKYEVSPETMCMDHLRDQDKHMTILDTGSWRYQRPTIPALALASFIDVFIDAVHATRWPLSTFLLSPGERTYLCIAPYALIANVPCPDALSKKTPVPE